MNSKSQLLSALLLGMAALASPGASYTLSLSSGFTAIANHLDRGGNHLSEILPVVPDGSGLFKFNNTIRSYEVANYDGSLGSWDNVLVLNPGEGAFINLPVAA